MRINSNGACEVVFSGRSRSTTICKNFIKSKIAGDIMKRKRNGYTLVEIVVALSGSAIVCGIVGSMVLFSMNMRC